MTRMFSSRRDRVRGNGWAAWLFAAFTFGFLLTLAQPSHADEAEEARQIIHQIANEQGRIQELLKDFARWVQSGGPSANWETSPNGIELARRQRVLANLNERLYQLRVTPPPERTPGNPPPGNKWVRVLKAGVWVWTLARIVSSDNPAEEVLDVGVAMGVGAGCAELGAGIGTLCFGPAGAPVGGMIGTAVAVIVTPRARDLAALIPGSGGKAPDVRPAPPPPPPPRSSAGAFGPPEKKFGKLAPAYEDHTQKVYGVMTPTSVSITLERVPLPDGAITLKHNYSDAPPDVLRPGDVIDLSCKSEATISGKFPPNIGGGCSWYVGGSVRIFDEESTRSTFVGIAGDGGFHAAGESHTKFEVQPGGSITIRAEQGGYLWGISDNRNPAEYVYTYTPE